MKQNTFLLQIAWSLLYIAELSKGYLISVLEDFPQLSFNLRCHCILSCMDCTLRSIVFLRISSFWSC